ncbi:50S ribosomal protein L25/general stress protein Ctc [Halothermothrix orenii]|uniref:Large ribosomal subunit protein bL25 n=1 Tax=Halothermothrix orenii (strain H 168 / OCM 544 / DSM 9562) TaxID=373903 RepID=RL25_HALOH|nr:50S ribosomal protein L25/general stress protein Ctc [Halothermothrix orenii]B8D015.1 RecName: Full=Large ribosomal subunit protein bL25; AltName: Full=50S ribosomal protein L25; AltName: Full=General stress protein CTC [Halothermothrix orenii H 168]ACL70867.1 ribosomal 5S rRNA E-loop binding protein Ctc/L25/TL5 [Halothermothrix orenii H 168]
MERYNLKAEVRKDTGKGVARKLRRNGLIPGVIYGKTRKPQPLAVDAKDLNKVVGGNAILDMTLVDGDKEEKETAVVKDLQRDPVQGNILHVDFQHISMTDKLTVSVPVHIVGNARGVVAGGVLQQLAREIEVECLPTDIPDEIEVDITDLGLGDSLSVGDIEPPANTDFITPEDEVIVTIVAPSEAVEEEVPAEDEEIMPEPEVIGEEDEGDEEEPEE